MANINLARLNPYDLHKHLINEYYLKKPGDTQKLQRDASKDKTDLDVIRENHKFLWESDDQPDTWEKQLAKRYYDKLFKEYCICDLSRYKENRVALRWRLEKEVVTGKGQFVCGNKSCQDKEALKSWEVNFGYLENGEKKNALIKLRLCPECSGKLNYHSKKREVKRSKRKTKRKIKISDSSGATASATTETDVQAAEIDEDNAAIDAAGEESDGENGEAPDPYKVQQLEENCWSKGTEIEEKSREEEFDEYLADLLL